MNRYRHLFFDLDNTLWDFSRNSHATLMELFIKYKLDIRVFERFYEVYNYHNDRLWSLYREKKITKEELVRERFDLAFAETGMAGLDGLKFNQEYLRLMPEQEHLCNGARAVLEKLSPRYDMHIITNGFSEVQHKKMETSGLSIFFKRVFISEEIKYPKPSPQIFRHALKSARARKKESLMIGDSWEVDIAGAMRTGIDQVHYTPLLEDLRFTESEMADIRRAKTNTFRIRHLEELLQLL